MKFAEILLEPVEIVRLKPRLKPARRRFVREEDTGFDEVPDKYRRFYRRWRGRGDRLAENEVLYLVYKVVIRSSRERQPGDRVYCRPCMSRLIVERSIARQLEARVLY